MLVSSETIVGNPLVPIVGVLLKLRLFVSPVEPTSTQVGADRLLSANAVCASSVVLAPKFLLTAATVTEDVELSNVPMWCKAENTVRGDPRSFPDPQTSKSPRHYHLVERFR